MLISPPRVRTFIFLRLQMAQPVRLFRWVRRAGRGGTLELGGGFSTPFSGDSLGAADSGAFGTPGMMDTVTQEAGSRSKIVHPQATIAHDPPRQFPRCSPLICRATGRGECQPATDDVSGNKEEGKCPMAG